MPSIFSLPNHVAPRVGAWIETIILPTYIFRTRMSHPVWVRGLKHIRRGFFCLCRVAPRVGAWIETDEEIEILNRMKSHPVWVRGLKPKRQYC